MEAPVVSAAPGGRHLDIADSVDLPAGASVTYTAVCAVDAGADGQVQNTASITEPVGVTDPVAGNNTATDSDLLIGACGFPKNLIMAGTIFNGPVDLTACLTITMGSDVTVSGTGILTLTAGESVNFIAPVNVQEFGGMSVTIDQTLLPA